MAERLEAFPTGPTRYPWDEWLNGDVWKLNYGEDFTIKLESLRSYAHTKASEMEKRVRTVIDGKDLIIQATDREPGEVSRRGRRPKSEAA